MTICEDFGGIEVTTKNAFGIGYINRKVLLKITWVSYGAYTITVQKAAELPMSANKYTEPKTDYSISITPEQVDKVAELFEAAETPERMQCYKPFYEDYDPDRSMFDMEHDTLFQAFKQKDRVILTNINFVCGVPSSMDSLNMTFEDYLKFKAYLDSKRDQVFYSGVKFGPAGVEAVWCGEKKPDHVK
jgi:hypothetical protein